MSKSAFDQIAAGMNDAIAYAKGQTEGAETHIPQEVDLRAIRKRLNLSQPAFAKRFGFSVGRIRDWEQQRTPMDTSSRVLLTVIEREPEAVERALSMKKAG
jgi:putative transcriptional regulator